jgi:hypothetical protein
LELPRVPRVFFGHDHPSPKSMVLRHFGELLEKYIEAFWKSMVLRHILEIYGIEAKMKNESTVLEHYVEP